MILQKPLYLLFCYYTLMLIRLFNFPCSLDCFSLSVHNQWWYQYDGRSAGTPWSRYKHCHACTTAKSAWGVYWFLVTEYAWALILILASQSPYVFICICVCVCVRMYVCLLTCVYVYVCVYVDMFEWLCSGVLLAVAAPAALRSTCCHYRTTCSARQQHVPFYQYYSTQSYLIQFNWIAVSRVPRSHGWEGHGELALLLGQYRLLVIRLQ